MFDKPSLVTRIAIGKGVGFVFGLIGFMCIPYFLPEADWMIRWGILLWYPTLGAVVGMFGVFTRHPVLSLPMPWWFRAPAIGAWMNFVLTFFAYEKMEAMLMSVFGQEGILSNPFWFVVEGAIVGLIIGFLATRFGGEGRDTIGS
ncbi:MAG: hypothetical protein V7776_12955 [Halopseudomonas aestusnigri]